MELNKRVILASGSPRRKELLEMIGVEFEVISGNQEENYKSTQPEDIVKELALMKAEYVAKIIESKYHKDFLIIGADTIVVMDNKIIEKPGDQEEALEMLRNLQGRSHYVYTGVALLNYVADRCKNHKGDKLEEKAEKEEQACGANGFKKEVFNFTAKTKVHIDSISDEEIKDYIKTGDPFDKAGGYGIQGRFAVFVKGIEGEYYNVMGLPVASLYKKIKQLSNNQPY